MTARQLPERPNIDQLKRQAKDLLHAARAHDADALARFRTLPAFAHHSDAAAEGSRTSRADRDHAAVGQLLLDAGSPVEWQTSAEPAESIVEIVNAWRGVAS